MVSDQGDVIWEKALRKKEGIVSRKIAGETILVPISGDLADMQKIFTLNSLAEFIWDRLDGRRLSDIRKEILSTFEVGQEQADTDIREFVGALLDAGLITGD
jgi:hypothetical protein